MKKPNKNSKGRQRTIKVNKYATKGLKEVL